MARVTPGQFTFAGGEIGPSMNGRVDLQAYYNTLQRSRNFKVTPQGNIEFMGGTVYAGTTQSDLIGRMIDFQFNVEQAYALEFTNLKMRVFKDQGLVTGGTLPVTTPYATADLDNIQYDQDKDVMYMVDGSNIPQKLTRTAHDTWTINDVEFIDGPYLAENVTTTTLNPSALSGSVTVVASAVTGINDDTGFQSTDVGRLIHFNDGTDYHYMTITAVASTLSVTATIGDPPLHTSSATTQWALGAFSDTTGWPTSVAFHENRIVYGMEQTLYGSKAAQYAEDYDTFTPGVDADDAYIYLTSVGSSIRWLASTEAFLAIGCQNAVLKANGGTDDTAITPTSINIKPVSFFGAADIMPIKMDRHIVYVQRDKKTVRTLEYEALRDGFVSVPRTVISEHIGDGLIKELAFQSGKTNIVWAVKEDGDLVGLTFEPQQEVAGWHSHDTQGNFKSICTVARSSDDDEVWVLVERTIDGSDHHYVEYMPLQPDIPKRIDYLTGDKTTDETNYGNAMYEAQKQVNHVHSGLVYNGKQATTLTLGAITGLGVTATAGAASFTASDVGKYITGDPIGVGIIRAYTSTTIVEIDVLVDFSSTSIASDGWYLTTDTVTGLTHLANTAVAVLGDGGVVENKTVDGSGDLALGNQYSYVLAGLAYEGKIISNNLEGGSQSGTSQTKKKNIHKLGFRFLNTMGCKYGTDHYNLSRINFRAVKDLMDRPVPLYTGFKVESVKDSWNREKRFLVVQENPLPCILQMVVPYFTSNDT